jgi:hypothetical protein
MKTLYTILSGCLLITSSFCFSQTWNGSLSSDWNVAANWTPANVPGPGSSVNISNASALYQPALAGDVSIASLSMSQGILNLNGHTLSCSGAAAFTGDSLLNGKISADDFTEVTNMRMGGKIILEKLNSSSANLWMGSNKVFHDSLIIVWHGGKLTLENLYPDSVFADFKIKILAGEVDPAFNHCLIVKKDMIIDNSGGGIILFGALGVASTNIGG